MSKEVYDKENFNIDETFFLEFDENDEVSEIQEYDKLPDILKMYYLDVSKYPLLTASEEKELGIVLKSVQNCILLDREASKKNELDYHLVIRNLILYKENTKVLFLIKEIMKFIDKKNDPIIKEISYVLNYNEISTQLIDTSQLLRLNDFKENLEIYLNYLKAKEKMINSNLRLVISFAKKYANYKINLTDLINEGNIGLIIATENFDVDKGFRFSTYAMYWIKQFIIRHLYLNSIDISVTENKLKEALKFRKKVEELENRTRKKYSYHELALILDIDYKKIIEYMYINPSISLNTPLTQEDDDTALIDIISKESDAIEKNIFCDNLKKDIECLFENLSSKEKEIIMLRFGLSDNEETTYTLEAIGKMYHVTKERIRAIEARALKKMRKNVERNPKAKQLKVYLTS